MTRVQWRLCLTLVCCATMVVACEGPVTLNPRPEDPSATGPSAGPGRANDEGEATEKERPSGGMQSPPDLAGGGPPQVSEPVVPYPDAGPAPDAGPDGGGGDAQDATPDRGAEAGEVADASSEGVSLVEGDDPRLVAH